MGLKRGRPPPASGLRLLATKRAFHWRAGFRFNLLVSDNDGGGRESCLAISPGLGDGKDPGLYPVVKF